MPHEFDQVRKVNVSRVSRSYDDASRARFREDLARRIANRQIRQIDELALVGHPILEPGHREVVAEVLRHAALTELEARR